MKRKSILSVALALSVIVSMVSFPLSVSGATTANRFTASTGMIKVGPDQILRISVGGLQGNDTIQVRFAWMKYMPAGCNNDGVCRHVVQAQGWAGPITLDSNEAASFDTPGETEVQALIRVDTTSMRDAARVRANGEINDSITGALVCHITWLDQDLNQ
jgi:hypothetical protein